MSYNFVSIMATALCLQSSVQAAALHHSSDCKATSNWPGWAGIKHAFILFNATLTQPTLTNPLGNPVAQQIENEWFPTYASKLSTAPWTSQDTLFAIFDGINDVGNSWSKGAPATTILNGEIFAVFQGLVDELYYAGAKNFAFLNVPPVYRAPLNLPNSSADQFKEKADIEAWNSALLDMAKSLKAEMPDVNVFTVNSYKYFTQVLDNPKSYPQTASYKNTTTYYIAYQNGTPKPDSFNSSCGISVDQYFWLNSLHPTYPMQDVLAEAVADQLGLGPNVC